MSVDNGSTMSLPIDDDTTMVVSHEWPCPLLSVVILQSLCMRMLCVS